MDAQLLSLNLYVGSIGLQLELVWAVVVPEVADHDPARAARHLRVSRSPCHVPRVQPHLNHGGWLQVDGVHDLLRVLMFT